MGKLGLDQLTGDQLLELNEEMCQELVARDPFLASMAQETITTHAERLAVKRKAAKKAVSKVLLDYMEEVQAETLAEVRQGVKDGTIRLLTPEQEARVVVGATHAAKIKLIIETVAAIHGGAAQKVMPKAPASATDMSTMTNTATELRQRDTATELRQRTLDAVLRMQARTVLPPLSTAAFEEYQKIVNQAVADQMMRGLPLNVPKLPPFKP